MSGFEAIGLVLSIYPVVIDGLKLYRAAASGQGIGILIDDLKSERLRYHQFLGHLFGADFVRSEELRLKQDTASHSKTSPRQRSNLERRLGKGKADLIFSTLESIKRVLESLQNDIKKATSVNDLDVGYSEKASRTLRAMRFIRGRSSFRDRLLQLRSLNDRLKLLLEEHPLPSSTGSCRNPLPNISFPRQHHSANDIYYAIHYGYQCPCDVAHSAQLGLPDFSNSMDYHTLSDYPSNPFKLLFVVEDSPETESKSIFPTLYSGDSDTRRKNFSLEGQTQEDLPTLSRSTSKVEELDERPSRRLSFISSTATLTTINTSSSSKSKLSKGHPLLIEECSEVQANPIQDLCTTIRTLDDAERGEIGVLSSREKMYELRKTTMQQNPASFDETIDLEDLLCNYQDTMSRRFRFGLALRLSYAVLQFFSTPWIDTKWSWKDFSINMNIDRQRNDAQLYITHHFYSSRRQVSKSKVQAAMSLGFWAGIGEETLTRLGFALIELGLGRRLSELRQDGSIEPDPRMATTKNQDMLDYWTAEGVLEAGLLYEEQCEDYEQVVRVLVKHEFTEGCNNKLLRSARPSFRKDMEDLVIAPLFCLWTEAWAKRPSSLSFERRFE